MMAFLDLDGTEQPMDPKLVLAIESAFRFVSMTSVEFVPAPRAWHEFDKRGAVSGPRGPRKAQIKIELAKRDGAKCAYCDREFVDLDDATLDHVIPNTIVRHWETWNLLLTCTACNNLKADRVPVILMPMLCHLLQILARTAKHKQDTEPSARTLANRLRKAKKRARRRHAQIREHIEALAGHPVRPALEAPKPRLALTAGEDNQR